MELTARALIVQYEERNLFYRVDRIRDILQSCVDDLDYFHHFYSIRSEAAVCAKLLCYALAADERLVEVSIRAQLGFSIIKITDLVSQWEDTFILRSARCSVEDVHKLRGIGSNLKTNAQFREKCTEEGIKGENQKILRSFVSFYSRYAKTTNIWKQTLDLRPACCILPQRLLPDANLPFFTQKR